MHTCGTFFSVCFVCFCFGNFKNDRSLLETNYKVSANKSPEANVAIENSQQIQIGPYLIMHLGSSRAKDQLTGHQIVKGPVNMKLIILSSYINRY